MESILHENIVEKETASNTSFCLLFLHYLFCSYVHIPVIGSFCACLVFIPDV